MTKHSNSSAELLRQVLSIWPIRYVLAFLVFLTTCPCFSFIPVVQAQLGDTSEQNPSEKSKEGRGNSSAVIGDSGYVVPIPEIKMKSIIGDQWQRSTPGAEEQERHVPSGEELPTKAPVHRLPFDPIDGESVGVGSIQDPSVDAPPVEESPVLSVPSDQLPEEPASARGSEEKEYENLLLKPPLAPEEIGDLPAVPRKEVLLKKPVYRLPVVLDNEPSKESPRTIPSERTEVHDMKDTTEWIPLDTRRDPEIVSLQEPELDRGSITKPEHGPVAESLHESSLEPQPMQVPEPDSREVQPGDSRSVPLEEKHQSKETIPSQESLAPPVKEFVLSPLNEDARDSREARDYLKETAPILEELSLLMTRAPALTMEDYDPSDANAAPVPQEILMKMNSLKRELRILDSKTFEVIPPAKYSDFHSLIRQSITQAYQACDSITNYFQENKSENFHNALDHLLKAGELIRRTRVPLEQG